MIAPCLIVAVSLKMYFTIERTLEWSEQASRVAGEHPAVQQGLAQVIVLPSMPALPAVIEAFRGTPVKVGAQDLFYEDRGSFTGGVSGADLRGLGCTYVEVGHVERRRIFGESDDVVNRKTLAAWRNDLIPLLCVGELERGHANKAAAECVRQLQSAIAGRDTSSRVHPLVVAYEPAWAIGGSQPASIAHIATVAGALQACLGTSADLDGTSVIYGGSARDGLMHDLLGTADGLFLGRYAHDAAALKTVLDEVGAP